MVRVGDVIENPVTGETMTFLLTGSETAGELLRIDMNVRPGGFVAGEHVHPRQEERFQVASGQITLRIKGDERRYSAGEHITIPPGTPHVWWNSGSDDLRVVLEFRPARRFAEFITTFFAMARTGKTNQRGVPKNVLQLAVTFASYRDVIYGTSPPRAVQQALFAVLDPVGRLLGYRPDVPYPRLPSVPVVIPTTSVTVDDESRRPERIGGQIDARPRSRGYTDPHAAFEPAHRCREHGTFRRTMRLP